MQKALIGAVAPEWLAQDRRELIHGYMSDVASFLKMATAAGIPVRTGSERAWHRLATMPCDRLETLIANFRVYREVCERSIREGENLTNDRQLLWRMIRRMGLTPASDLFDKLEDGDVIEIYDQNSNQIYRNLQFFKVSSYTFEDLMHYQLQELFGRSLWSTIKLLNEIRQLRSPNFRGTIRSSLGEHEVREKLSQRRYRAKVNQKYYSPLFNAEGEKVALVATLTVNLVGADQEVRWSEKT